jgi:hypothetical protein
MSFRRKHAIYAAHVRTMTAGPPDSNAFNLPPFLVAIDGHDDVERCDSNPTVLSLQRYAAALGMGLHVSLIKAD